MRWKKSEIESNGIITIFSFFNKKLFFENQILNEVNTCIICLPLGPKA